MDNSRKSPNLTSIIHDFCTLTSIYPSCQVDPKWAKMGAFGHFVPESTHFRHQFLLFRQYQKAAKGTIPKGMSALAQGMLPGALGGSTGSGVERAPAAGVSVGRAGGSGWVLGGRMTGSAGAFSSTTS
jgi:hypothetical protein